MVRSCLTLLITHHSLSRAAQRWGVRTVPELVNAVRAIWQASHEFLATTMPVEYVPPPPQGWRFSVADGMAEIVLQKHATKKTLVVATVI
jgi:hypothetical protein